MHVTNKGFAKGTPATPDYLSQPAQMPPLPHSETWPHDTRSTATNSSHNDDDDDDDDDD